MELNAEINKVFGTEMAKLFAASLSEEEIMKAARNSFDNLTAHYDSYGYRKDNTQMDDMVRKAMVDNMVGIIDSIVKDEAYQEKCRKLAEQIVEEICEETHRKLVDSVSSRLCGQALGDYCGMSLRGFIESTVDSMMHR